jgi:Ca2+-dependent lipid-binding protein
VYWNNELIGRSSVVYKCLNPHWSDAYFTIRLAKRSMPLPDCCLKIEVFDWDRFTADDPLGQVRHDSHSKTGVEEYR